MLRSILSSPYRRNFNLSNLRCISTTPHLSASWVDKVKGVFTGQKTESSETANSFTLLQYAEEMRMARKVRALKEPAVGRGSEATFDDLFEKHVAILRYLGGVDPTGENIQISHKFDAAKQCNCSMVEVENTLAKFSWAKAVQVKLQQLQAEGKPLPKSMAEMQKMMEKSPLDVARSNFAKSVQISRNALCPCGSKKLFKRIPRPYIHNLLLESRIKVLWEGQEQLTV